MLPDCFRPFAENTGREGGVVGTSSDTLSFNVSTTVTVSIPLGSRGSSQFVGITASATDLWVPEPASARKKSTDDRGSLFGCSSGLGQELPRIGPRSRARGVCTVAVASQEYRGWRIALGESSSSRMHRLPQGVSDRACSGGGLAAVPPLTGPEVKPREYSMFDTLLLSVKPLGNSSP